MTFQDDGLQLLRLRDLGVDEAMTEAVRHASTALYNSQRTQTAQKILAISPADDGVRPVVLRRGVLMPENPPKRFLVQQADPAVDAFATQPAILAKLTALTGLDLAYYAGQLWVTLVPPANYQPFLSQTWHRDPYDGTGNRIVKLFWYLDDVDGGAGPFEYIAGSREVEKPTGLSALDRYIHVQHYATLNAHQRRIVCTGPRDTVILADTSGIHRGGHCTTRPRLSVTLVYTA